MRLAVCLLLAIVFVGCPGKHADDITFQQLPAGAFTLCWPDGETASFTVVDDRFEENDPLLVRIESNEFELVPVSGAEPTSGGFQTTAAEARFRFRARTCFVGEKTVTIIVSQVDPDPIKEQIVTIRNDCSCDEPEPAAPLSCETNLPVAFGRVAGTDGTPQAGVEIDNDGMTVTTDAAGRFFVLDPSILTIEGTEIASGFGPAVTNLSTIVVPGALANEGTVPTANGRVTTTTRIGDFAEFTVDALVGNAADPNLVTVRYEEIAPEQINAAPPDGVAAVFAAFVEMDAEFEFLADALIGDLGIARGIPLCWYRLDGSTWVEVANTTVLEDGAGYRVAHGLPRSGQYMLGAKFSPTVTVTGTVEDPDGNPLPDVEVRSTTGARTRTGADGTYSLEVPIVQSAQTGGYLSFDLVYTPSPVSGRTVFRETVDTPVPDETIAREPVVLPGNALGAAFFLVLDNLAPRPGVPLGVNGTMLTTDAWGIAVKYGFAAGSHDVEGPDGRCPIEIRDGVLSTFVIQNAGNRGPVEVTIVPHIVSDPARPVEIPGLTEVRMFVGGEEYGGLTNTNGLVRFRVPETGRTELKTTVFAPNGQSFVLAASYDRIAPRNGRVALPLLDRVPEWPFVQDETIQVDVENFQPGETAFAVAWERVRNEAVSGQFPLDDQGRARPFGPEDRTAIVLQWKDGFNETTKVEVGYPEDTVFGPDAFEALRLDGLLDVEAKAELLAAAFRWGIGGEINVPFWLRDARIPVRTVLIERAADGDFGVELDFGDYSVVASPAAELPDTLAVDPPVDKPAFTHTLEGNVLVVRFVPEQIEHPYVLIFEDAAAKYVAHISPDEAGTEVVRRYPLPEGADLRNHSVRLSVPCFEEVDGATRQPLPPEPVDAAFVTFRGRRLAVSMARPWEITNAFYEGPVEIAKLAYKWKVLVKYGYFYDIGTEVEVIR